MDDTISRTDAIKAMADAIWHYPNECYQNLNDYGIAKELACAGLRSVPSANSKQLQILANILDRNSEDPVSITVDENSATFENADYQLSCRFINGRYPNYNSVIPEGTPYTMAVDRLTLLNAVRRVAVFANVGGLVRLDLSPTQVVLTAQDVDHSTADEETIACEYNGEPMNIGFKSADVIDVVNNIDSEGVFLKLLDPARAGVFVPSEQKAGEDLIVLQMPMMI